MQTRDEVRLVLDRNFKSLMDCLGQLTEEELTERPVAGDWTVKDILAHVWDWGEEIMHTAKAWLGPRTWQAGISYDDAWNESHVAAKRILPLITVVDGVTGVHRRMMHFLDLTDDTVLEQVGRTPEGEDLPLIDMLYQTAQHYAEHAQSLSVFQLHCLGTEDDPRDTAC